MQHHIAVSAVQLAVEAWQHQRRRGRLDAPHLQAAKLAGRADSATPARPCGRPAPRPARAPPAAEPAECIGKKRDPKMLLIDHSLAPATLRYGMWEW